jgi:hypothetical protein
MGPMIMREARPRHFRIGNGQISDRVSPEHRYFRGEAQINARSDRVSQTGEFERIICGDHEQGRDDPASGEVS